MTGRDHRGPLPGDDQGPDEEIQRTGDQPSWSRRKGRSPASRRKNRWIGIGLAVALLAGVVAAVVSLTTGNTPVASSGPSGSVSSVGATGPGSGGTAPKGGTSTAKAKVISAAKLAQNGGALSPPTSKRGNVVGWQSGVGGRDLTAVSTRLGQALQAAGVKQYASMKSACVQLASNVATAQAGPPIPDTSMQKLYTKALTELAHGAVDCRSALSVKSNGEETSQVNINRTLLHQSTSELSAGATDVFRATAEIQILSRQHH